MNCLNPNILNIIGLCFDMVGACFVAFEVVKRFHGEKYTTKNPSFGDPVSDMTSEKTDKYDKWANIKYYSMQIGLILLLFGFSIQIIANIVQLSTR